MAPDFHDPIERERTPGSPAETMALHGAGSYCRRCKTVKCEEWKTAHLANVMAEFLPRNPSAAAAVARES